MKRSDFSFLIAFVVALFLHALLGVVLRYHPLVLAAPATPVEAPPPVSLRFVEVPPVTRPVQEPPDTRNLSDANRVRGSLEPAKTGLPPGRPGPRSAPAPRPASPPRTAPSPVQAESTGPGEIQAAPSQPSDLRPTPDQGRQLAESLENLERFIQPGGAGGDGSGGTPTPDPGSGVYFDTRGYDLGPWANRVIAIVKQNWLIPVAADLGYQGIVSVSFEVDRSGKLSDIKVISQSGVSSFDQAAVNALRTSDPFPPLPADFPRPALPAVFRFYYNTPVPQ